MSNAGTNVRGADTLEGLPPLIGPSPRVLVLGSMPGGESLARREYYAHPRNDFWRIVEDALGVPRALHYTARVAALNHAGIALWDVLAECRRRGSLDAAIAREGQRPNDIPRLLNEHPGIRRIAFNGIFAERSFHAVIGSDALPQALECRRLPSTSPANASIPYPRKLEQWQDALCAST